MSHQTDWDDYYLKPARPTDFTRSITRAKIVRTLKPYISGSIVMCELGGANSSVLDEICRHYDITNYHILDTNDFGLSLLPEECRGAKVTHSCSDVLLRNPELSEKYDLVLSVGLIEHFNRRGTKRAILSHLDAAKIGGYILITFPTPTLLYRLIRKVAETLGIWKFHDERPLKATEVISAMYNQVEILHRSTNWWIGLTQYYILARKISRAPTE